jgi:hypothetical protein
MRRRALVVVVVCALGCGGAPLVNGGRATSRARDAGDDATGLDAGTDAAGTDATSGDTSADAGDEGAVLGEELDVFSSALGVAICHRFVECCSIADMQALTGTSDEAACAADLTVGARNAALIELSFGGVAFDPAASERCVHEVRASSCAAVFEGKSGALIPCHDVFPGIQRLGQRCDDDTMCVSHDCVLRACVERPASPTCLASETVDSVTNICVALRGPGEACGDARPCAAPLVCGGAGTCGVRPAEGEPCTSDDQCVGACGFTVDGVTRACRPALCQGR